MKPEMISRDNNGFERMPRQSFREGVSIMEEKIDLTEINKKVDGKLLDLLHHPSIEKVYGNLITDE
jgi:hypothetical protein